MEVETWKILDQNQNLCSVLQKIGEDEVRRLIHILKRRNNVESVLGQGGYGTVTRLTTTTGQAVAVKQQQRTTDWLKEVHENEKRVLLLAQNKKMDRVVRLLGYNFVQSTWTGYIVLECADYSGHDIVTRVRPLPEGEELRDMIVQHAQALQQIHSLGYLHNDLKPDNFLHFIANRRWKICDLGLAYPATTHKASWPHQKLTPGQENTFPDGFFIACASSAYQVEGAWNADGKGENIWDRLVHQTPSIVKNNDTGDVTCDSYHKYKEDVQLIKQVGFSHYRFSISWSRVLPTGHDDIVNQAGLDYYHNLIDELLANGIEPMVTLYHWDLPQPLQDLGGWTNPLMANYFEDYARVVFSEFGNKVKWWITINEPRNIIRGYGPSRSDFNFLAPMIFQAGIGDYLAAHTLIRAHAKAYRLYDNEFRSSQNGKISITLDCRFYQPKTDSWEDKVATFRASDFEIGVFAHPIFSKEGDYPAIVKERVDLHSVKEGRATSRLPRFTEEEITQIRGSYDFFGLNHYTSSLVSAGEEGHNPSFMRDAGAVLGYDPNWPTAKSAWLKVVPYGLRGVLNYIKDKYDNVPVFITENGFSSDSGLEDQDRIQYFHDYLSQMLLAMYEDGCYVVGYTAWSILDNFEWANGYSERFGFYYVNFTDPGRPRRKKMSADYFEKMIKTSKLPDVTELLDVNKEI